MFLSADEVAELTRKVRPSAQVRALNAMGIEHLVRPDGSPVVVRNLLTPDLANDKLRVSEPNWSAL